MTVRVGVYGRDQDRVAAAKTHQYIWVHTRLEKCLSWSVRRVYK